MNLTKYIFIIIVYLSIINCQCEDYEYGDANYDNNLDIVDIVIKELKERKLIDEKN